MTPQDQFVPQPFPRRIVGRHQEKLQIYWQDGHESRFEALQLRKICPCAACVDEREKRQQGALMVIDQPPPAIERLILENIEMVGNYAIQITWNDGHNTGIYSFRYLRDQCECAECCASRQL